MKQKMSNEEIADILADAREYLEQHGWCRGNLRTTDGKVCAVGAIGMSQNWLSDTRQWTYEATAKVAHILTFMGRVIEETTFGENAQALVNWNDEDAENMQEVLDLFAKAEKIARFGSDPDA